jgi:uncharacterized protein YjbI with pentapeptide repeats
MQRSTLIPLIEGKKLENLDLSEVDIDDLDFSNCSISNVIFATSEQEKRIIKNVNFKDAQLHQVIFDHAELENCNFDCSKTPDKASIEAVSFKNAHLKNCRFRNAHILWTDFRYAQIDQATFEAALINFSDFYRAFLVGVVIFRKSIIKSSSLYYTYFGDGSTIRRSNLYQGKLIQQNKKVYRKFLIEWREYTHRLRKNDQKDAVSDWNAEDAVQSRFSDAEDIYKTLNGLWMSRGFMEDANWAYVLGRRMERYRMIHEFSDQKNILQKISSSLNIFWNFVSDLMFGYGESILKMILSYILIIILFAYFYYAAPGVSLPSYLYALEVSLKNMVAISSEDVSGISPMVDFLNLVQTTLGILLTGIFGFILGNKIRSQ